MWCGELRVKVLLGHGTLGADARGEAGGGEADPVAARPTAGHHDVLQACLMARLNQMGGGLFSYHVSA